MREGSRSCFAPAGGYVGFLGLHQLAFLLKELKDRTIELHLSMDWGGWDSDSDSLLLWEAFVSQEAHTDEDEHTDEALTGAAEFMNRYPDDLDSDLYHRDDELDLSLAGAAMLWAGITDDPEVLEQELLVIRPEQSHSDVELEIERRNFNDPVGSQ